MGRSRDKEPPTEDIALVTSTDRAAKRQGIGRKSPLETLAEQTMLGDRTGAMPVISTALTGVIPAVEEGGDETPPMPEPAGTLLIRESEIFWPDPNFEELDFTDEGFEAKYPLQSIVPASLVNTSIETGIPLSELEMVFSSANILQIYDIAGSTNADRRLRDHPEFLETHFKPIHAIITQCVLKYGGDILAYEGDCQIAVFQANNETGRKNANFEIAQEVGKYCRELSNMLPEGEYVGLRCIALSAQGLKIRAEKGIGTIFDDKAMAVSRSGAEKEVKKAEADLQESEKNGVYFYTSAGPTGNIVYRENHSIKPDPYNGVQTKIRFNPAKNQPDTEKIKEDILRAIDPPSAEERLALSRTARNIGAAVYMELIGTRDSAQLKIIREAIAKEFESYGGYIDKAIGDGLLVIFGAGFDMEQEDILERAVRASMRIKTLLDERREAFSGIHAAIGISNLDITSRLTLGTKERRETTTIGGPANTGARMKSIAKRRAMDVTQTVVIVGVPFHGISDYCHAVETVEGSIRGIGEMCISQITTIKQPQKTRLYKQEDTPPELTQGQEEAMAEFKTAVQKKPITVLSGANVVAQEIFIRHLPEEGDLLCTLKFESVDRYTEYGSLYDFLSEMELHEQFQEVKNSPSVTQLKRELTDISGKTGQERASAHAKILSLFARILREINLTISGTLYICALEADLMDQKSREVMEEAAKTEGDTVKLILAGRDLPPGTDTKNSANMKISMDEVDIESAKRILSFMLRSRTGVAKEPLSKEDMNRLIQPLIAEGDGDLRQTVNMMSIGIYLRTLISRGDLFQKGDKWAISDTAAPLAYSKTEIFKEMIGPLVRGLKGSKGRRLENLALCFGVAHGFLDYKDIPEGILTSEEEFEEFARMLAQKRILKKAPQIEDKTEDLRLFSNDSYELEPRLREAAEECLQASRELKGQVHFAIADKYGTDTFEVTAEMLPEQKRSRLARRAHFLDQARLHFKYAKIDEKNIDLLLMYLKTLRTVSTEDFDIRSEEPISRLFGHDIEALAGKVMVRKDLGDKNTEFSEAKYELIELLGLFNTALYRARSNVDIGWLYTHEGLMGWENHLNLEADHAANANSVISQIKAIAASREIEDLSARLLYVASKKEAEAIDRDDGITFRISELVNEIDSSLEQILNHRAGGTKLLVRQIAFLHLGAGVHNQYAKALTRLGRQRIQDTPSVHLQIALKRARLAATLSEQLATNDSRDINATCMDVRRGIDQFLNVARQGDDHLLPTPIIFDTNRPLQDIVQNITITARHTEGMIAITETGVEFFDLLPWVEKRDVDTDAKDTLRRESINSQSINTKSRLEAAITLNSGLTEGEYTFDHSQDPTLSPEDDTNFLSVINRARELVQIKNRHLQERSKRRDPKQALSPLTQLTENYKILGRCIFATVYGDSTDPGEREDARRKYKNLMTKGRSIGMVASEVNGFMEDVGNAMYEFVIRFNTAELDLDLAAISETPEEKANAQAQFDESMTRMHELHTKCDTGGDTDVMCGPFNLTQDIKKLYTWGALVGLQVPDDSFDVKSLHTLTTDMAAVTAEESGYDLEIIDDPE